MPTVVQQYLGHSWRQLIVYTVKCRADKPFRQLTKLLLSPPNDIKTLATHRYFKWNRPLVISWQRWMQLYYNHAEAGSLCVCCSSEYNRRNMGSCHHSTASGRWRFLLHCDIDQRQVDLTFPAMHLCAFFSVGNQCTGSLLQREKDGRQLYDSVVVDCVQSTND